ncbi:MAG: hypothetical protein OEU26_35855 [Candidatus Tectomicrobia bacterium]|nr:hypothetical protein [Candidatus Tectomicrobia bacterium]
MTDKPLPPFSVVPVVRVTLELSFRSDVERLQNARIDGGDHIDGAIQIVLIDPGFPCVRKAALDSRLTIAREGDGKPHKNFLALVEVRHGVGIAVELTEIGFFVHHVLLDRTRLTGRDSAAVRRLQTLL